MLNRFEVVREFVNEGYLVPMDVAVELMADGYDVSSFDRDLSGFSVEELVSHYEEIYE